MDLAKLLILGLAGYGVFALLTKSAPGPKAPGPAPPPVPEPPKGFAIAADCSDIGISDPAVASKWFDTVADEIIATKPVDPFEVARQVLERASPGCATLDKFGPDGAKKAFGLLLAVTKRMREAGLLTPSQEEDERAKAKAWANEKGAGIP